MDTMDRLRELSLIREPLLSRIAELEALCKAQEEEAAKLHLSHAPCRTDSCLKGARIAELEAMLERAMENIGNMLPWEARLTDVEEMLEKMTDGLEHQMLDNPPHENAAPALHACIYEARALLKEGES